MTITNVSTGTFQQKILVVDKMIQETQKFKRSHTTFFEILKSSQVFHKTIANNILFPVNIIGQYLSMKFCVLAFLWLYGN
jgi:hypothetical protein